MPVRPVSPSEVSGTAHSSGPTNSYQFFNSPLKISHRQMISNETKNDVNEFY